MYSFQSIARIALVTAGMMLLCACDRRTPEERLQAAMEFYQQGDLTSAEMEALKVLEKAPDDPLSVNANQILAHIYAQQNMMEDAELQLESALKKVSQKEDVGRQLLKSYVELLVAQQKYDQSIKLVNDYQQEYKDEPGTSLSLKMLGVVIRSDAGRTTEARTILQDQIDQTTDPAEMRIYRDLYFGTLQRDGNTTAAIAYKMEDLNRTSDAEGKASVKITLSSLYAELGDYAQARMYLDNVTTQFSETMRKELDNHARLGRTLQFAQAYEQLGNLPGARRIYQVLYDAAAKEKSLLQPVTMGMVRTLMREGDTSGVESYLKELVATYPDEQSKLQLENFQKLAASGELQQMAQPDTSPIVMKYRQDPNILWPTDLADILNLKDGATTGTTSTASVEAPAETDTPVVKESPASAETEAEIPVAPEAVTSDTTATSPTL